MYDQCSASLRAVVVALVLTTCAGLRPRRVPLAHSRAMRSARAAGVTIKEAAGGKGLGAFTQRAITVGTWVAEYEGEVLTRAEVVVRYWGGFDEDDRYFAPTAADSSWLASRARRRVPTTGDYLFDLSGSLTFVGTRHEVFVDAEDVHRSGWTRFMNDADEHDCNLSTVVDRDATPFRLRFRATRDIEPGEELQYSYGDEYWQEAEESVDEKGE